LPSLIVAALVTLYVRGLRLSNAGYALAAVLLFLHTIGNYVLGRFENG